MTGHLEASNALIQDCRMMVFRSGTDLYAIPLLKVQEVIGHTPITPVAFTPDYVQGIINLRGRVISIIDFRQRLCQKKTEMTKETSFVILDVKQISIGIIVDSVEFVATFDPGSLSAPDELEGLMKRSDSLLAIARKDDTLIQAVNIEKFLDVDEVKKHIEAAKQQKHHAQTSDQPDPESSWSKSGDAESGTDAEEEHDTDLSSNHITAA